MLRTASKRDRPAVGAAHAVAIPMGGQTVAGASGLSIALSLNALDAACWQEGTLSMDLTVAQGEALGARALHAGLTVVD